MGWHAPSLSSFSFSQSSPQQKFFQHSDIQTREFLLTSAQACDNITPHFEESIGEMSERFKELVLKTSDVGNGTVGSNPTLSATSFETNRPGEVPKWPKGLPC